MSALSALLRAGATGSLGFIPGVTQSSAAAAGGGGGSSSSSFGVRSSSAQPARASAAAFSSFAAAQHVPRRRPTRPPPNGDMSAPGRTGDDDDDDDDDSAAMDDGDDGVAGFDSAPVAVPPAAYAAAAAAPASASASASASCVQVHPDTVLAPRTRRRVLQFYAVPPADGYGGGGLETPASPWNGMRFRLRKCEPRGLVRAVFEQSGLAEGRGDNFHVMWTGGGVKSHTLQHLGPLQKINHFPRSVEITRKDRLIANVQRMQQQHGVRNFDFLPRSFRLPTDANEFADAAARERGAVWIVKPRASSQGRGIFLCTSASEVPLDEHLVVQRYVPNPLLIDGLKFDMRIYVAVTSFAPLRIYMYRDGLARFSTEPYTYSAASLTNRYVHLTNYSVNKRSTNFVHNTDPFADDQGSKWSLRALRACMRRQDVDVDTIWSNIADMVVKTILAAEDSVLSGLRMFVPYRSNCFELFGFDVLIDDTLRPWLLEVNLSPSLNCDSPLDLRLKSEMLADLFTMAGVRPGDPLAQAPGAEMSVRHALSDALSESDVRKLVADTLDEHDRRGGWDRVYPTASAPRYDSFFEQPRPINRLVFAELCAQAPPAPFRAPTDELCGGDSADNDSDASVDSGVGAALSAPTSSSSLLGAQAARSRTPAAIPQSPQRSSALVSPLRPVSRVAPPSAASGAARAAAASSTPTSTSLPPIGKPEKRRSSSAMPVRRADDAENAPLPPARAVTAPTTAPLTLSPLEAREAFAVHLERLLKRLRVAGSEAEAELRNVVQLLCQAQCSSPFTPPQGAEQTDVRFVARKLAEFIAAYRRDTDDLLARVGLGDAAIPAPRRALIMTASDTALESALSAFTQSFAESAELFLGDGSPVGAGAGDALEPESSDGEDGEDVDGVDAVPAAASVRAAVPSFGQAHAGPPASPADGVLRRARMQANAFVERRQALAHR